MPQIKKSLQSLSRSGAVWWLCILPGIYLRLQQYLLNRPLWGDEAAVALNVIHRSFAGLTRLLDYNQAAPIGFLFLEKVSTILLGSSEYSLRLTPLLAGMLAVYLLGRLSQSAFGIAGLFAVVMFSISWWPVYYASELKQYSSDVTAAVLLVFLAGNCFKERGQFKDFLSLGIAGSLLVWISHPSVFTMVGIGLALALEKLLRKEFAPWSWILGVGLAWLASFGLEYLVSLRNIIGNEFLITYWRKAYAPMPPWSNKSWYLGTFYSFLFYAFHRADNLMAVITLVLTGIGAISLLLRDRRTALMVISPFLVTTIASALQRYPLKERFTLFLIPLLFLLMAEGLGGIYRLLARWRPDVSALVSTLLALAIVWQIAPITYGKAVRMPGKNIRYVFQYVAENRRPEDTLYIFHLTDVVFTYYAPAYGLDSGDIVRGVYYSNRKAAFQSFQDDVQGLAGDPRVWFIFSELVDCLDCGGEDTQGYYLAYINHFGAMIDSFDGADANAYLYDLSP